MVKQILTEMVHAIARGGPSSYPSMVTSQLTREHLQQQQQKKKKKKKKRREQKEMFESEGPSPLSSYLESSVGSRAPSSTLGACRPGEVLIFILLSGNPRFHLYITCSYYFTIHLLRL